MPGLATELEADRKWLAHRSDQFVEFDCPVCDVAGSPSFTKKGFEYQRCGKCRTAFMSPRPSEELLHEFYSTSRTYAYWNRYVFPASEQVRREKIFSPRVTRVLEFCERYRTNTKTLLEIGAGFGTFCEEVMARDLFERVIALEMTPDLANSCRERGLEVIEQPVETLSLAAGSIDVVAAFETLEHLFDPRGFFSSIYELLADDGLIVLTCPSIDGFDIISLGEQSDTIDHEHLNYFNPDSIEQLASQCGFDVLEVLTPGKLDADIVRNKVLAGAISVDGQPWLRHVLIDRWGLVGEAFQEFLAANRMSTHMWLIATKR